MVWNASKTNNVTDRRQVLAQGSISLAMTAILTCTASGYVYIDASAKSFGSNASIQTGDTQMVIEAA